METWEAGRTGTGLSTQRHAELHPSQGCAAACGVQTAPKHVPSAGSRGCQSKVPQSGELETVGLSLSQFWRAEVPKRCPWALLPQRLGGRSRARLSQLGGVGTPWLGAACLQSLSHGFSSSHMSLVRTRVPGFRASLSNPGCSHLKTLRLITNAKSLFPIRAHAGVRQWTYVSGATIQPSSVCPLAP